MTELPGQKDGNNDLRCLLMGQGFIVRKADRHYYIA